MFDTLRYSKTLEAVGVSRDQAEAHIRIIAEIVEGDMATKSDIERLEHKLLDLEHRLIIKLGTIIAVTLAALAAISKIIN